MALGCFPTSSLGLRALDGVDDRLDAVRSPGTTILCLVGLATGLGSSSSTGICRSSSVSSEGTAFDLVVWGRLVILFLSELPDRLLTISFCMWVVPGSAFLTLLRELTDLEGASFLETFFFAGGEADEDVGVDDDGVNEEVNSDVTNDEDVADGDMGGAG